MRSFIHDISIYGIVIHSECIILSGRNRNHQGLAVAILKLWEKSLVVKIAVKRGIQNTNNKLMADELKVCSIFSSASFVNDICQCPILNWPVVELVAQCKTTLVIHINLLDLIMI